MFNINIEKKVIPEYNLNKLVVIQKNDLSVPIQSINKKADTQTVLPSESDQESKYLFEIY